MHSVSTIIKPLGNSSWRGVIVRLLQDDQSVAPEVKPLYLPFAMFQRSTLCEPVVYNPGLMLLGESFEPFLLSILRSPSRSEF